MDSRGPYGSRGILICSTCLNKQRVPVLAGQTKIKVFDLTIKYFLNVGENVKFQKKP